MSEPTRPTSKAELMTQIDESWSALTDAVNRIDPTRLAAPGPEGWSVKDQLGHVSAWERSLIALLTGQSRAAAVGMDEVSYAAADVDQINAQILAGTSAMPYAEVMAQAQTTHAELIGILDRMSWGDLNKPYSHYQRGRRLGDSAEESDPPVLDAVLGNTTEHYPEHREYLERDATPAR